MPAPRKYNDELRERAVRTVHETIKENPGIPVKRACNQVGEQLGIPGSTLRNWLRAPGPVPGSSATAADPHERLVQLERENRELRRANAILRSASAAAFKIALSSRSLRSSAFNRRTSSRSALVIPSTSPASTLDWLTQPRSVSRPIPSREPTTSHVARIVGYSERCSCTILTARAFSSSVNFFGMTCILPDRKRCGRNLGRFTDQALDGEPRDPRESLNAATTQLTTMLTHIRAAADCAEAAQQAINGQGMKSN